MIESLLLTATRVFTFDQQRVLTNASAFFFERDSRLFLVTSRHVLIDEPSEHRPDRVEIELHTHAEKMPSAIAFSIPLYSNGEAVWHQGIDGGGQIDVAVVQIDRRALPQSTVYGAFTPAHLYGPRDQVAV